MSSSRITSHNDSIALFFLFCAYQTFARPVFVIRHDEKGSTLTTARHGTCKLLHLYNDRFRFALSNSRVHRTIRFCASNDRSARFDLTDALLYDYELCPMRLLLINSPTCCCSRTFIQIAPQTMFYYRNLAENIY